MSDEEIDLPADFGPLTSDEGQQVLAALGVQVLDEDDDLFTHEYLTAEDLARPDVVANIAAINEVAALALWALQNEESELWGWWQGPDQIPLERAPVVRYDTEGQFELMAGRDMATALAVHYSWDEEERYQAIRDALADLGLDLPATLADAQLWPEVTPTPRTLHEQAFSRRHPPG